MHQQVRTKAPSKSQLVVGAHRKLPTALLTFHLKALPAQHTSPSPSDPGTPQRNTLASNRGSACRKGHVALRASWGNSHHISPLQSGMLLALLLPVHTNACSRAGRECGASGQVRAGAGRSGHRPAALDGARGVVRVAGGERPNRPERVVALVQQPVAARALRSHAQNA